MGVGCRDAEPGVSMTKEEMRTFASGATRGGGNKLDYSGFYCPWVLERYAQYLNSHMIDAGGRERESDNWKKGIPKIEYLRSLLRHVIDIWKGQLSGAMSRELVQDAACAIMFNVMGWLHEDLKEEHRTPVRHML